MKKNFLLAMVVMLMTAVSSFRSERIQYGDYAQ